MARKKTKASTRKTTIQDLGAKTDARGGLLPAVRIYSAPVYPGDALIDDTSLNFKTR